MFRVLGLPNHQLPNAQVRSNRFSGPHFQVLNYRGEVAELGDEALCLQGQNLRSSNVPGSWGSRLAQHGSDGR